MLFKNLHKKDIMELLPVFFLTCTFFIFGPIELYVSNITELWFSFGDVLWPSLLTFFIVSIFFFIIGVFLQGRWREYYICLLVGIGLALYIQGNFIRTDYGTLDGRAIQWENYKLTAVWNTLLWIFCIIAPFIGRILFKRQYKIGIAIISSYIIFIQAIGLGALLITTDFSKDSSQNAYLSTSNLYTVSKEKNVLIFVLDTFDQRYLDEIFSESPEYTVPLDGFVGYTNTTSAYPVTFVSMPYILTGQGYTNEQPYNDYISEAYKNTDYYTLLQKAGYDIGLYTEDDFVSNTAKETFIGNAQKGNVSVSSYFDLERAMLKFTSFRYLPHIAKKYVWFYSGIFEKLKSSDSTNMPAYTMDNLSFYTQLVENRLDFLPNNQKAYRLIHLMGAHAPYTLNSDVTVANEGEATAITASKASLNIVYEYLDQLRTMELYDNTLVIITADHGEHARFGTSPILLIKNFDVRGESHTTNIPVSHTNLIPTIMDTLGLNTNEKYGKSIYDISDQDHTDRIHNVCPAKQEEGYALDITEYKVTPEKVFIQTGTKYTRTGIETYIPYIYKAGQEIVFREDDDGRRYFNQICEVENDFAWSFGTFGQMLLNVGDLSGQLTGNISFKYIFNAPQRLIIRCKGQTLYDEEVSSSEEPVTFKIPPDCIEDGMLILTLEYPDAVSPRSLGQSDDGRILAFAFSLICLYPS